VRTVVIIDGGYLDKVMNNLCNPKFDYKDLINELVGADELVMVNYYHCLPYKNSFSNEKSLSYYASKYKFYDALSHIDKFEIKLGKLVYRGTTQRGEEIFEQKKVDSMIAVDITVMAVRREVDRIVLIAGDADHIPPVELAQKEGIIVSLYHGSFSSGKGSPSLELHDLCQFKCNLEAVIIDLVKK
jgi:uncharacterized LabA/DUF88 family protein